MIILVLKIIFLNVTFLLRFSVYCKLIYKQFDNIINLSIFTEQESLKILFLKIYVLINTQGKRQPHLNGISAWVIFI
jgi:hypothetical protein